MALALVLVATPVAAQDAFGEFKVLTPELALKAAQAAMIQCRDGGYQVGVAVVDRFGGSQVFLRDRFAGGHVEETAIRKAWTAVSFRMSTAELAEATQPGQPAFGIRQLEGPLALAGGLPVEAGDGTLVAGIGVSGAPSPTEDEACAVAGIEAIEADIAF
jgi:uncharacterized protein GlcG (DUF336 family)